MSLAVLLPHYKNLDGLRVTLDSLQAESQDFVVYIIDDGSQQDEQLTGIVAECNIREKIILVNIKNNVGITKALNYGLGKILEAGKYKYIARIDAGDVNKNDRFKKQVQFLERHEQVYLLGSYVSFVDVFHKEMFIFKPVNAHKEIKKYIHVYNPFIHPAVMYRVECIKDIGLYPEGYPALEDHAYFMMISKRFETAILKEVLVEYEINPQGISQSKRKLQTKSRIKLFKNFFYFGFHPIYGLLRAYVTNALPSRFLNQVKKILFKLREN